MANEIQDIHQTLQQGEIILYQPDETVRLEVRLEDETVWLTQAQMAELFQTTKNNVTLHIGNVYKENELSPIATSKESLLVQMEGNRQEHHTKPIVNDTRYEKKYGTEYYTKRTVPFVYRYTKKIALK